MILFPWDSLSWSELRQARLEPAFSSLFSWQPATTEAVIADRPLRETPLGLSDAEWVPWAPQRDATLTSL